MLLGSHIESGPVGRTCSMCALSKPTSDFIPRNARCVDCRRIKSRSYAQSDRGKEMKRRYWQKHGDRLRALKRLQENANADLIRDRKLRYYYGISLDYFRELLAQQGGVCAICLQPERAKRGGRVKSLAVDHDHATGAVRGLLCCSCNTAVGLIRECPDILNNIRSYLARNKALSAVVGAVPPAAPTGLRIVR
jgi:hypothetical protein